MGSCSGYERTTGTDRRLCRGAGCGVGAGDLKLAKEGWLLAYNFARLKLPASKPSKGFCVDESVVSSGYALYFLLAGGKPIIKRSVTIIKMCSWLLKKKKKSECF